MLKFSTARIRIAASSIGCISSSQGWRYPRCVQNLRQRQQWWTQWSSRSGSGRPSFYDCADINNVNR
eukprot:6277939-Pyramimonas_sp.AAC.1